MSKVSERKTVLITGSNRGIGYALAHKLAHTGAYTVILTARSIDSAKKAASEIGGADGVVVPKRLDVEDEASIRACAEEVRAEFGKLDVLVNNAGVCLDMIADREGLSVQELWAKTYSINVIGTQLVTSAFAPLLLKSASQGEGGPSRIVFVSSSVGSLGLDATVDMGYNKPLPPAQKGEWPKEDPGAFPAYRASKAAMNMLAREVRRQLHNDGVRVFITCPGRVATTFGGWQEDQARSQGGIAVEEPARFLEEMIKGKWDEHEGEFIHQGGVYPF